MSSAFADTSFYQALLNPRDEWHKAALDLSNAYYDEVVTTEYVLVELAALMSRGNLRQLFVELVAQLRATVTTHIVPSSAELFEAGVVLFSRRRDKNWSLTDCISFSVMERLGITHALASDRHFEQAGFRLLLQQ